MTDHYDFTEHEWHWNTPDIYQADIELRKVAALEAIANNTARIAAALEAGQQEQRYEYNLVVATMSRGIVDSDGWQTVAQFGDTLVLRRPLPAADEASEEAVDGKPRYKVSCPACGNGDEHLRDCPLANE